VPDPLGSLLLLAAGLFCIRHGYRMARADVSRWAARRLAVIRRTDMREWYRQEP
jgi:hypothetical protein